MNVDRTWSAREFAALLGDWAAGTAPLYRELAGAVAGAIRIGDLGVGDRLPAERALAGTLVVSRATVLAAYRELRRLGLAETRRGSGTRVGAVAGPRTARTPDAVLRRFVDPPGDVISLARTGDVPVPRLREAVLAVAEEDLPLLQTGLGYHPRGLPVLREAIAVRMSAQGSPTTADQIVVTTGATQALALVAGLHVRKGATVLVESPNWPGSLDVFREAGARLVGVPIDDEGVRVDLLAEALTRHRPALVYLMPSCHNPTGTTMTPARRRWIGGLVARHGVPVVEDNAYGTALTAAPPPPLAAHAPPTAQVLTVESLAKPVWGGLRIGWVRAPAETADRLARRKALADLGSSVLDQAVAARLLPELDELTAETGRELRIRLAHVSALLAAGLPEWRWTPPASGSALWIELPGVDAERFAHVALRHGVEVTPGGAAALEAGFATWIRLPFAYPPDVMTEAVTRLARAWRAMEG